MSSPVAETAAFLAPHHDDILLSLPGTLLSPLNACDAPRQVVVVFSEESPAMTAICSERHRHTGVAVSALGFDEALRRGLSLRACFDAGRTLRDWSSEGDGLIDAIAISLRSVLAQLAPATVFAPLMPVHVDHALVRAAAERLASERPAWRLAYYEDQPYCALAPGSLRRQTTGLVATRAGQEPWSAARILDLWRPLHDVVGPRDCARILRYWQRGSAAGDAFEPPCVHRRDAIES